LTVAGVGFAAGPVMLRFARIASFRTTGDAVMVDFP
jgi:hypothetical protein